MVYKYTMDPKTPILYLGVCSKSAQSLSIKAIFGDPINPQRKNPNYKPSEQRIFGNDIFKTVEARLFDKMSEEERMEVIRDLKRQKQRKIMELAQGKDFVQLNAISSTTLRKTGLRRKYKLNSITYEQECAKVMQRRSSMRMEQESMRVFLHNQSILRREMKALLTEALLDREKLLTFFKTWTTISYFIDIMSSLRVQVTQRRKRIEDIQKVAGTFAQYVFRNVQLMKSKGETFEQRNQVQYVL